MMMKKIVGLGAFLLSLYAGAVSAAWQLNLTPGATKSTQVIYDLHNLMMWIILAIFVAVFGVMFYSVYAHRKSVGHKAEQFHENTTVELIWTIVPFFIMFALAWPATKSLLDVRDTSSPDMTIKVTGYQWKWGYDYIKGEGGSISFLSQLSTLQDQIYGKANTAMAAFGTQLSDTEIAAVVTYERSNWGHKTGTVVQLSEVKAARK